MKCLICNKEMEMQFDSITKKKSKYLWRCEKCMPKGIQIAVLGEETKSLSQTRNEN